MRKFLILIPLCLAACGDNGADFGTSLQPAELVLHAPQIADLDLSPTRATVMEGDGSVSVTASFAFTDIGLDIETIHVEISDGTSFTMPFTEQETAVSGTRSEQLDFSTATIGSYTVEVWLVDKLASTSNHAIAAFEVIDPAQSTEWDARWTNRLAGVPYGLTDVVWDGEYFVAVGDGGIILTSSDGIAWIERESGTDADLNAVAFDGTVIVAGGIDTAVLLSKDHGESWSIKNSGGRVSLGGVAINASQIVAGGMDLNTGDVFMMRSLDLGETWAVLDSLPQQDHFVTDLIYANGLFVAATDVFSWLSDARVLVSPDGENWQSIVLRDEVAATYALVHDGERIIAAGGENAVFASVDGFYWTQLTTPAEMANVTYGGAAWSGSRLVIHGGLTWWYWWFGTPPHQAAGISSADGGATWQIFDIDGYYQSNGMAWGNGRFVSVGETTPISGLGAIYTSD